MWNNVHKKNKVKETIKVQRGVAKFPKSLVYLNCKYLVRVDFTGLPRSTLVCTAITRKQ